MSLSRELMREKSALICVIGWVIISQSMKNKYSREVSNTQLLWNLDPSKNLNMSALPKLLYYLLTLSQSHCFCGVCFSSVVLLKSHYSNPKMCIKNRCKCSQRRKNPKRKLLKSVFSVYNHSWHSCRQLHVIIEQLLNVIPVQLIKYHHDLPICL